MRIFIYSTTAIVALTAPAVAQQSIKDWNGWFVGGQIGFSQSVATYEDPDYDWYGHTMDFKALGGGVGVQFGYNSVSNNRLNGIVLDVTSLGTSETDIYASDNNVPNKAKYLATLRGRTGLAVDNTLLYLTGGLAFAEFERSWTEFNDTSDSWPDLGASKLGIALGFGFERAINDRWSVSGEYTANVFGENTSTNDDDFPLRINDTIHRVAVAFNYSLGGPRDMGGSSTGTGTPADFSGAYLGGLIGFGSADISQSDIEYDDFGGTYDVNNAGALAGLTAGYNWQDGAAVYGVEAQLGFPNMSASYEADSDDIETSVDTTFSIRGRAGVALDNTLMYVLGGITVAEMTNDYENEEDLSGTYTGLTIGAGVEQMLSNNLSWNVEAAYTRFDGGEFDSDDGYHGHADMLQISAGLNYHLAGKGIRAGSGALAPARDWSGGFYGVDIAALANKGTVWDQDYYEFGGDFDVTSLGGGIGGHVGYNWQNGSFVYGAIADIAFYSNDEARRDSGNREVSSSIDAMATIRGRAGIASGQSMFYVTGGLAAARSELEHSYLPSPDTDSFDLSDTRIGTVVGLGMEHALNDRTSLRVEGLMSRFPAQSYENGEDCSGPPGFDGGDCNMDGSDSNVQIKAGMSWAF